MGNWKFKAVDYHCRHEHGTPFLSLEDDEGNDIIIVKTCDYMHIEEAHRRQIEAVPTMLAALKAWAKYDQAICKRSGDGNFVLNAGQAIAEGHDLDTLYEEAKTLMDSVLDNLPRLPT